MGYTRDSTLGPVCAGPRVSGEPLGPHHRSIGNVVMGMTMFIHFFFSSFFVFCFRERGALPIYRESADKTVLYFYCVLLRPIVLLYSRNLKLFPARRYIRKYIGDVWFHVSCTRHLNDAARQSISTDSKRKENIKSNSGVLELKKRKFFGRVLLRRWRWFFK